MDKININEIIRNPSAERNILSIISNNVDMLVECSAQGLYAEHFAVNINGVIYAILCCLAEDGAKKVDSNMIESLISSDTNKKELAELGGIDYLHGILQNNVLCDNIKSYVKILKDCFKKRQLYLLCEEAQQETIKTGETEKLLQEMQSKLLNLSLEDGKEEVYSFGKSAYERLKALEEAPKSVKGFETGWKRFDNITQGLSGNDLIVVVAPSKTGKSTFLLNIANRLAFSGLKGLYIDTEMSDEEQENRYISLVSKVPQKEIANGMFGVDTEYGKAEEKKLKVYGAIKDINENSNLIHVYMPDFSIDKVTALIRKYKIQEQIDFVIFDYIKLPNGDINSLNTSQEYQRLGYFTTCLKDMAGICDIPVITAGQSNRDDLNGTNPDASSIGGSYRILQMASKLFFLRNKTQEEMQMEGGIRGNQKLHIAYQRNGDSGEAIDFMFDKPISRMFEVS